MKLAPGRVVLPFLALSSLVVWFAACDSPANTGAGASSNGAAGTGTGAAGSGSGTAGTGSGATGSGSGTAGSGSGAAGSGSGTSTSSGNSTGGNGTGGSGSSSSSSSSTGGTGGTATSSSSSSSSGGSTSSTGTGGAPPTAFCAKGCASAVDCKVDTGAFDTDNYACNGGACTYLGCKTDDECATSFSNPAYVCAKAPSSGIATCAKGCASAVDCKVDTGAFDTDNYACNGGACTYLGCKTDGECATSFSNPAYVCAEAPSSGIATCAKGCASPADCKVDTGAFDTDNYACNRGACTYLGCKTDGECATSFSNPAYVCDGD
jgi:hypothetical protein